MIRYNNQDIAGCRRWNGTAWEDIKNVRRWNGTAWEDVELQEGVLYEVGMDLEQSRQKCFITADFDIVGSIDPFWTNEGLKLKDSMGLIPVYITMKYLPIHIYDYLNIEIERDLLSTRMLGRVDVSLKAEQGDGNYIELKKDTFRIGAMETQHHFCMYLSTAKEEMKAMRLEHLKVVLCITSIVLPNFPDNFSMIKKVWLSK